jgi:GntR family transcriptional regulator, arabinose operon transcriptional repressor
MMEPLLQQVDPRSRVPRAAQARAILEDAIRNGLFPAGARLPGTGEIGRQLHVSLVTAHKAIRSLVTEGLLLRKQGKGTFVRGARLRPGRKRARWRVALVLHPENVMGDFYHGTLVQAIRMAARQHRPVSDLIMTPIDHLKEVDSIDADGFLCFHPSRDEFALLEKARDRRHVVVLGASLPDTGVHCVDSENCDGARQAVRRLIQLGHERIAIINGPRNSTNCADRFQGYCEEMKASRIPIYDRFIFDAALDESAAAVTHRFVRAMRECDRPTAVVACGYYLALDAITVLRQLGLSIPRDVSVVGFDDPRSAALLNPALTTVRQPLEQMGARAYARLVKLMEGRSPSPRLEMLPTSLMLRESTGPVA